VLLRVHGKFHALVQVAFQNDSRFQETLDKVTTASFLPTGRWLTSLWLHSCLQACRSFINTNSVTKASKTSRSPELLAKYCDALLKKSSKNPPEDQLEQILMEVMVIFNVS